MIFLFYSVWYVEVERDMFICAIYVAIGEKTESDTFIWTLKENNINHYISWRILSSRSPCNSANKRCNLCLKEKLLIIRRPQLSSLNKRNELVSSCRHGNKTLLRNNWVLFLCKFIKWRNDGTNILNNKIPWWVSNHETGL